MQKDTMEKYHTSLCMPRKRIDIETLNNREHLSKWYIIHGIFGRNSFLAAILGNQIIIYTLDYIMYLC